MWWGVIVCLLPVPEVRGHLNFTQIAWLYRDGQSKTLNKVEAEKASRESSRLHTPVEAEGSHLSLFGVSSKSRHTFLMDGSEAQENSQLPEGVRKMSVKEQTR